MKTTECLYQARMVMRFFCYNSAMRCRIHFSHRILLFLFHIFRIFALFFALSTISWWIKSETTTNEVKKSSKMPTKEKNNHKKVVYTGYVLYTGLPRQFGASLQDARSLNGSSVLHVSNCHVLLFLDPISS
jgi:hypothetical protein